MRYILFKEVKPKHKCFFCNKKSEVRIKVKGKKAYYTCDDCFAKKIEEWSSKWRQEKK